MGTTQTPRNIRLNENGRVQLISNIMEGAITLQDLDKLMANHLRFGYPFSMFSRDDFERATFGHDYWAFECINGTMVICVVPRN